MKGQVLPGESTFIIVQLIMLKFQDFNTISSKKQLLSSHYTAHNRHEV